MRTAIVVGVLLIMAGALAYTIIHSQSSHATGVNLEKRIALLDLEDSQKGKIMPGGGTVYKIAKELALEKRSCMSIPPGTAAIFEKLPIYPGAKLSFFLGGTKTASVEVVVAAHGTEGRGLSFSCETHAAGKEWHPITRDLSSFEGSSVTITFRNSLAPEGEPVLVANPVVLSQGRTILSQDYPPITTEEVVSDLVASFSTAEKIRSNPEKPLEVFPIRFDPEKRTEADEAKKGIRAAPDSAFAYLVEIPAGSYLEVALFSYPFDGLNAKDPGHVEFQVSVDQEALISFRSDFININQPEVMFYDRLTYKARIDLAPWAGKKVRIRFSSLCAAKEVQHRFEYLWWDLLIKRKIAIPRRIASRERPNVLMICVDALRADHLGCYGYERPTSPHLDRFAEQGLLFEKAFSPCSWTLPATASLLTGLYPNTHGVLGNTRNYLVDGITTVAECLTWQGVTTGGFSANDLVCSAINFDQGFQVFHEVLENAEGVHEDLFSWLEACGPFQFFAYVHYMEPHSPYSAPGAYRQHFDPEYVETRDYSGPLPERWRTGQIDTAFTKDEFEHLVNLYDSEIYYWDLQFKKLLDRLEELSLLDKTVIIVTADHGEEFFEHEGLGHGVTLYNEVIQVPLIIHDPRTKKGLRLGDYVETTSLFSTTLDLMGYTKPDFLQVKSLFPLKGLSQRFDRLYASTESNFPGFEARWAALIEPPFKVITDLIKDTEELYNLDRDYEEKGNLAADLPEKTELLKTRSIEWYRNSAEAFPKEFQPLTPELKARLEALGYVDGER